MPRQARISRDQVLETTLHIAEERGLDGVSMRAVAERLGVTPMALYHHVRNKEALLDDLVERLLTELPIPDPTPPWQQRLHALASSLRDTAARHPDVFLMLLRRPASTPAAKHTREAVYEVLRDAGIPGELVPRVERLLSTFIIGFAASESAGRFGKHKRSLLDADLSWALTQIEALINLAAAQSGSVETPMASAARRRSATR
jgi:AcrR family transcriptional regulator